MRQRHKRFLEWNNERVAKRQDFGIFSSWLPAVIGSVASAASAGASIASATRGAPKPPQAPTPPAADPKVSEAVATQRRQLTKAAGYRSTILSDQLREYAGGGKRTLGG